MKKKAQSTVLVKWVRSGIGFPRRQKDMVRSLGLRRLNQVVECPDTPHVRGLVACVPHLVEIVAQPVAPAWASVPEYRITPAAASPEEPTAATAAKPESLAVEEAAPDASSTPAEAAPKKRSRAKKSPAPSEGAEPGEPDEE
ncbi:MAG TPA: 50S ribosomal protein L30 [Terriglobia bacterium]|nr:50S ribosomal protein L30 [Terriglobia bacterium]